MYVAAHKLVAIVVFVVVQIHCWRSCCRLACALNPTIIPPVLPSRSPSFVLPPIPCSILSIHRLNQPLRQLIIHDRRVWRQDCQKYMRRLHLLALTLPMRKGSERGKDGLEVGDREDVGDVAGEDEFGLFLRA